MKKLWIAGPLLVVVASGAIAYAWWQTPASTTEDRASQDSSNVLGTQTAMKDWQTSYFTTRIPTTYKLKSSNDGTDNGSYLLTSTTARISDQVGVTIGQLGSNSLSETSGVRLRLNQSDVYAPVAPGYAPDGAYAFTNEDGYETSVFWQHGGQYVAVVASGTAARRAELDEALQAIVTNWVWQ